LFDALVAVHAARTMRSLRGVASRSDGVCLKLLRTINLEDGVVPYNDTGDFRPTIVTLSKIALL
jgi:hypothetical protein